MQNSEKINVIIINFRENKKYINKHEQMNK